jgi:hypothetical protein
MSGTIGDARKRIAEAAAAERDWLANNGEWTDDTPEPTA